LHNRELVLCIYLSLFACWSWWRWGLSANSLYTTMLLHWKMSTFKKGGPMKPSNEIRWLIDLDFLSVGEKLLWLFFTVGFWNPRVSLGCMRLQPSRIHPLQTERVAKSNNQIWLTSWKSLIPFTIMILTSSVAWICFSHSNLLMLSSLLPQLIEAVSTLNTWTSF
jgi:hypothetical protein